jgi:PAS domain S-box-containing protein
MSGTVTRNDLRFLTKDGDWRWMSARLAPVLDENGNVVGRVAGWHDVTAEYALREQLHEHEEQFRILAENASDIVVRVDGTGIVQWISPSVRSMLGWSADELVGRPATDVVHVADLEMVGAPHAFAESDGPVHFEARLECEDGSLRWMAAAVRPVIDEREARIIGRVVGLRDIDAEVRARAALEISEREAQEASQAKTVFLSRMSHELRTPLNAVLGFAQLLQLDHLTPAQAETVERIVTGGRHLHDLINEVLDITSIESGRMTMSFETVGLADVVTEALDLVRGLAASVDVAVEPFDASQCHQTVFADRQRVVQILLNLLSNAIKYNRPAGSVRVHCAPADDGMVGVAVEDTGPGIAPGLHDRVFQPFDRLGAERTGIEGTGIGLAVSRALAETMNGRLELQSTVDVGSTFTLRLPGAAREVS